MPQPVAFLVIDRFALRSDGTRRGFEDFCVLNARRTDEKYHGTYETSIMKRFAVCSYTWQRAVRRSTLQPNPHLSGELAFYRRSEPGRLHQ